MSEAGSNGEEEEAEVYVVEAIMASRYDAFNKEYRYLIKWLGYSSKDNTWEPASNLNCPELLAAYEADEKEKDPTTKPESKPTKGGRKSLPTDAKTKTIAKPVNGKGKGKARAGPSEDEEDSEDNQASIAELDKRRAAAKKKAAKQPRTSTTRAEQAVASKWEKKEEKKAKEALTGTPNPKTSKAKPNSKASVKPTSGRQDRTERSESPAKAASNEKPSPSKHKGKRPVIPDESGSESGDEPPSKPPAKKTRGTPNRPTTSSSSSRTGSSAAPIQPANVVSSSSAASSTSNALRALQFKRNPPVAPQNPTSNTTSADSSEITDDPTPVSTNRPPSEEHATPLNNEDSGAKPASKPSVRFADDQETPNGADSQAQASSSTVNERDAVAAAATEAENRRQTLAGLQSRLITSEYYRRTPIFHEKSMAAACAEAVCVGHGTVLRMKGRGVAIICDSRDQMVSGEGIALGLLLMMIGARMPKQLSEVAVVCVHRRETLAPIEKMYNELVHMETHHVEFLHFGDNEPIEPILVSGFLVIPSLTALQQGMAVESFCIKSREANVCNCTVLAHPASIVLARSRLPQWQKIMGTLGNSNILIAEKQELSLSSPFAGIDRNNYLDPRLSSSTLPAVTTQSEIAEITSLLCWKREQEPARWRRFVIVVDQVEPSLAEAAKDRGIELCTWVGLTELTSECLF
ncbi:uncharacterized protein JCM6883_003524 [Sporobolomyces salmoneus]|uniref:uncharacterized protein n=1 Tax=Sporobolomyces salmoneus TaxID=183962 RepID=UPI00316B211E